MRCLLSVTHVTAEYPENHVIYDIAPLWRSYVLYRICSQPAAVDLGLGRYDTLEEAKAAAQSDAGTYTLTWSTPA